MFEFFAGFICAFLIFSVAIQELVSIVMLAMGEWNTKKEFYRALIPYPFLLIWQIIKEFKKLK